MTSHREPVRATERIQSREAVDPQLVEYVLAVVPDAPAAEVVFDAVVALADSGATRLLDGAVVSRRHDRSVVVVDVDIRVPDESSRWNRTGILSTRDLELIGTSVPVGAVGVIAVVEDVWAASLASAVRSVGGRIAGGERIPSARLVQFVPELTEADGREPR